MGPQHLSTTLYCPYCKLGLNSDLGMLIAGAWFASLNASVRINQVDGAVLLLACCRNFVIVRSSPPDHSTKQLECWLGGNCQRVYRVSQKTHFLNCNFAKPGLRVRGPPLPVEQATCSGRPRSLKPGLQSDNSESAPILGHPLYLFLWSFAAASINRYRACCIYGCLCQKSLEPISLRNSTCFLRQVNRGFRISVNP